MGLRIVSPGWATTIQDAGRCGYGHLGVPRAGAVDRERYALVNRLVGNAPGVAVLETAGGLVLEAVGTVLIARSDHGAVGVLEPGERIIVGPIGGEVWGYLAVRGGVDAERELGSCSTDTLSGLGPPPLTAGDVLGVGPDPRTELVADVAPPRLRDRVARLLRGPQSGRVDVAMLTAGEWVVQPGSDRVGVRVRVQGFDATSLPSATFEMPSQPLVEGAVQLTPSGELIVMLANHPTTGGYPVVGVVTPDDVGVVAQTPAGGAIRAGIVPESGTDHAQIAPRGGSAPDR